ncbi:MAG: peptidase M61 [Bacteroidetes bacterium]|jgi:predicted metalloprotease with PDZ domain|nr:peptidase M61 [Bacteroidota bacterium]
MKKYVPLLLLLFIWSCSPKSGSQLQEDDTSAQAVPIETSIDLTMMENDQLTVRVDPGDFEKDTVLFRLPRVIPGTYMESNFGFFVENMTAFYMDGSSAPVNPTDTNTWTLSDATTVDYLEYKVNDTFDIENTEKETPYSMAGTNIAEEIYVLNLHGFVGYFEGFQENRYELNITSPTDFKRASALHITSSDTTANQVTTTYYADRYFEVIDNPMMYGNFTKEEFEVDGIDIVFSLYSPSGNHTASGQKDVIYDIMSAQKDYLGDLETTDRYSIFLYMASQSQDATDFGALEHHTSTVMVYPDYVNDNQLEEGLVDVISHEFFHIVTPLNLHSEDIRYFDYYSPTFSKHLWMYEGLTEYFASHFQIYEGLDTKEEFYEKISQKIQYAESFNDTLSFTEMSENVLDEPYASNYLNVYMKGALINMCLDIIMREESENTQSMITLMKDLTERYGSERPFDDDALIEEIENMTFPEIGEFIGTHVIGSTPINYGAYLNKVGLRQAEEELPTAFFFADQSTPFFNVDQTEGTIFFREDIELHSTLKNLGAQGGDVIVSVNGEPFNFQTAQQIIGSSMSWNPDTEIEIVVERDGEEITLTGEYGNPVYIKSILKEMENPSENQLRLRGWWLGEN